MKNNKKEKYHKPKLEEYGNIEDITLGGGRGYPDAEDEASNFG